MSNVPPPQPPAASVVLIDANMSWSSVFKLTFKFSVAILAIWTLFSIPLAVLSGTARSWQDSAREAQVREAQERLFLPD